MLAYELRRRYGYRVVLIMIPEFIHEHGDHFRLLTFQGLVRDIGLEPAITRMRIECPRDCRGANYRAFAEVRRVGGLLNYGDILRHGLQELGDWEIFHAYALTADGRAIDAHGIQSEEAVIKRVFEHMEAGVAVENLTARWELKAGEEPSVSEMCSLSAARDAQLRKALEGMMKRVGKYFDHQSIPTRKGSTR
jgi:hypothetical protein